MTAPLSFQAPACVRTLSRSANAPDRRAWRKTVASSQRGGFVPSLSPRQLPGANHAPGLLIHSLPHVLQDFADQRIQPRHVCFLQVRPFNRTRRFRHAVHINRLLGNFVQGLSRH